MPSNIFAGEPGELEAWCWFQVLFEFRFGQCQKVVTVAPPVKWHPISNAELRNNMENSQNMSE